MLVKSPSLFYFENKQGIRACVVPNFHPGREKMSIIWKLWIAILQTSLLVSRDEISTGIPSWNLCPGRKSPYNQSLSLFVSMSGPKCIYITDLSKAFDCIFNDLLIAKLNAYGLSLSAMKLVHSCLQNRKRRTKIGSSYSLWEEIVSGFPQGSIFV